MSDEQSVQSETINDNQLNDWGTTIDMDASVLVDYDGNTVNITVPTNEQEIKIYRNGLLQYQSINGGDTLDYDFTAGNVVTFTEALTAGETVIIEKLS